MEMMTAIVREASSQYPSTICALVTAIVTTKRIGFRTEQIAIGTHKSRLGDFAPMSTNSLYIGEILILSYIFEPRREISNHVVCATSKGSDQPAHTRSLIRAFASRLHIL